MFRKLPTLILAGMLCSPAIANVKNILFGTHYSTRWQQGLYVLFNDEQNHWSNEFKIKNLPDLIDSDLIEFTDAQCFGKNCIAVGWWSDWNYHHPMLLTSQDGGVTWAQTERIDGIPTKVNYLQGDLQRITCDGQHCIAVGAFKDAASNDQNYSVLVSDNGGRSWIAGKLDAPQSLSLHGIACIGKHCVTGLGLYVAEGISVSADGGLTWKAIDFSLPQLWIRAISASGNNFVAAGGYGGDSAIFVSRDYGNTWDMKTTSDNDYYYVLNCNQQVCIAATGGKKPLVSVSKDQGMTWSRLENATPLPTGLVAASIYHLACTERACVMIGNYHTGGMPIPLVLTVDLRILENYQIRSNTLDKNLYLDTVSCKNDRCYIAGHNQKQSRYKLSLPFLLEASDDLSNWKDISDRNYAADVDNVRIHRMVTP